MRNLAELQEEVRKLGLEVPRTVGRKAKAPYVSALRQHFLRKEGLSYQELSPMLCFSYWYLSEKEREPLWEDRDWLCQEKLNGVRCVLHFIKGVGVFGHGRTENKSVYRRTEFTDRLVLRDFTPDFTATIDGELVVRTEDGTRWSLQTTAALLRMRPVESLRIQQMTPLVLHAFDIANWQGADLRDKRLCERLPYLKDFQGALSEQVKKYFEFPPYQIYNKRLCYDMILANGGEGCVLKNLNSRYEDSTKRLKWGWVKCKRQTELDAFVTGFVRGSLAGDYSDKVGSLIFSITTEEGPLEIARISNLTWEFRKAISEFDRASNTVTLDPTIYGRVARVSGLEISYRAGRLVHPELVFWNRGVEASKCVYSFRDYERLRQGESGVVLAKLVTEGGEKTG